MEKLKQWWWALLLVVVLLGGLFYWYELREFFVVKHCQQNTVRTVVEELKERFIVDKEKVETYYNFYFHNCLRSKGINK